MSGGTWALPTGPHVALIDESSRQGTYLLAVVLVQRSEIRATRAALRRLALPGQATIHFRHESARRKKSCLVSLAKMPVHALVVASAERRAPVARRACLEFVVGSIAETGVTELVLERCAGEERRDRQILAAATKGLPITYRHESRRAEPLLWLPDWVAWSWPQGGDWRRRVTPVVRWSTTV